MAGSHFGEGAATAGSVNVGLLIGNSWGVTEGILESDHRTGDRNIRADRRRLWEAHRDVMSKPVVVTATAGCRPPGGFSLGCEHESVYSTAGPKIHASGHRK